jgi:hypothetical protein
MGSRAGIVQCGLMTPESVALLGGLLFLLIAIVGGGFTIREIIMPRVPMWARAASLLVGVALVVPYFGTGSGPSPLGDAAADSPAPSPSAPPREGVVYEDGERDVSEDGIEVSGLRASGEHAKPSPGDRIRIQFSLRNVGSGAVTFDETFIGARNPDDDNKDFAHGNEGDLLAPGDAVKISSSIVVDARGIWQFFPCYSLRTRGEGSYCPDEWRAFEVAVE